MSENDETLVKDSRAKEDLIYLRVNRNRIPEYLEGLMKEHAVEMRESGDGSARVYALPRPIGREIQYLEKYCSNPYPSDPFFSSEYGFSTKREAWEHLREVIRKKGRLGTYSSFPTLEEFKKQKGD